MFMGHSECVTDIQGWKRSVQAAQSGRTGPQSVTERSARREKLCTSIRRNTRYHRTHSTPTTASIAAATPAPTSSPRPAPLPLLIVVVHLTQEMLRHYLRKCVQLVLHLSHVQTFGCRSMDACQTEGIPYQSTASHSTAAPQ